jgi:cell division protein FtsQ
VLVVVAAAGAAGYFLWLRDSSLVAVTDVEVAGVTSGDPERIVGELTRLAEQQTTLHVDADRIARAAEAFPTVKAVSVDANFPHGMRIEVTERPPALVVETDAERVAAAADGTLLAGVAVPDDGQLPTLEVGGLSPSARKLEGQPLDQALILGAAPEPLKPLVHAVEFDRDHGVEVTLRGGIPVRFGRGSGAEEKWAAAAAVLASPKVDALTYLDVRVPERPVVGGNG